jgi:hypothetical protein
MTQFEGFKIVNLRDTKSSKFVSYVTCADLKLLIRTESCHPRAGEGVNVGAEGTLDIPIFLPPPPALGENSKLVLHVPELGPLAPSQVSVSQNASMQAASPEYHPWLPPRALISWRRFSGRWGNHNA